MGWGLEGAADIVADAPAGTGAAAIVVLFLVTAGAEYNTCGFPITAVEF